MLDETPERIRVNGFTLYRPAPSQKKAKPSQKFRYAGFWIRFFALLIDGLLFGILFYFIFVWGDVWRSSKLMYISSYIIRNMLCLTYFVYFHGRWGQTLGKRALRIKVVCVDGSEIGYYRVLIRRAVGILTGVLSALSMIMVARQIPDATWSEMSTLTSWEWKSEYDQFVKHTMYMWLNWFALGWSLGEVICLLANKKKRAIHDFIAGTVVVHR